jgi:ppGpp synthetase/RelA/SpoT-type nucleotidyltranferase
MPLYGLDSMPDLVIVRSQEKDVVGSFLKDYGECYIHCKDFATAVESNSEKQLLELKDSNGQPVLAQVSSHVKDKESLAKKLTTRHGSKSYKNMGDICKDIVDLIGVLIILYTANDAQHGRVFDMIKE